MKVEYIKHDGGRKEAEDHGAVPRRKRAGDCVTRALTLAGIRNYAENWNDFAEKNVLRGKAKSADHGVNIKIWWPILMAAGFSRMTANCSFHKSFGSVKNVAACIKGIAILETDRHVVTVKDGKIMDAWDSSKRRVKQIFLAPDAEITGGYIVDCWMSDFIREMRDRGISLKVQERMIRDVNRWHAVKRHAKETIDRWRRVYYHKPEGMEVVEFNPGVHKINLRKF